MLVLGFAVAFVLVGVCGRFGGGGVFLGCFFRGRGVCSALAGLRHAAHRVWGGVGLGAAGAGAGVAALAGGAPASGLSARSPPVGGACCVTTRLLPGDWGRPSRLTERDLRRTPRRDWRPDLRVSTRGLWWRWSAPASGLPARSPPGERGCCVTTLLPVKGGPSSFRVTAGDSPSGERQVAPHPGEGRATLPLLDGRSCSPVQGR